MTVPSPDPAQRDYGCFGRLSAAYDASRRGLPSATVAFVVQHLGGPQVLDLACGTGISSRQLAEEGFDVTGCDADPLMLRYAIARGGAHIRYAIGRAEAIPFRNAAFDGVTSFCGYHWFDPWRAVPEMIRVLRSDGRIVIVNIRGRDGLYDDYRTLVAQFVSGDLPDHRKTYNPRRDFEAHGLRCLAEHGESVSQTSTADELFQALQSVSVWNLIPEALLAQACDALSAFCVEHAGGTSVTREIAYDTIVAGR